MFNSPRVNRDGPRDSPWARAEEFLDIVRGCLWRIAQTSSLPSFSDRVSEQKEWWSRLDTTIEDYNQEASTGRGVKLNASQSERLLDLLKEAVESDIPGQTLEGLIGFHSKPERLSVLYAKSQNSGNLEAAFALNHRGIPAPIGFQESPFQIRSNGEVVATLDFPELLEQLEEHHRTMKKNLQEECGAVVAETADFHTGLLYGLAVAESSILNNPDPAKGQAFAELAPRVSFLSLTQLFYHIDMQMEGYRDERIHEIVGRGTVGSITHEMKTRYNQKASPNVCFFEPDLLNMYDRDEVYAEKDATDLMALQYALTSPYGLLYEGITESSAEEVHTFAKLGRLGYSFRLWRFDAQRYRDPETGESTSLLEQFGLERAPVRATDRFEEGPHFWGPGYRAHIDRQFEELLPQMWFEHGFTQADAERGFTAELRRAYLLIADEEHGTLLVRNSSARFGRDRLPHPVMWSPNPYLLGAKGRNSDALSPGDISSDFQPFLKCEIYRQVFTQTSALPQLVDRALMVREALASWKFETRHHRSWEGEGDDAWLLGGHNSRGFGNVVKMLKALEVDEGPLVDLTLVRRDRAPAQFIPFHRGERRLPVGKENRRLLEIMACSNPTEREVGLIQKAGIQDFIQAGINHEAELLIVPRGGV